MSWDSAPQSSGPALTNRSSFTWPFTLKQKGRAFGFGFRVCISPADPAAALSRGSPYSAHLSARPCAKSATATPATCSASRLPALARACASYCSGTWVHARSPTPCHRLPFCGKLESRKAGKPESRKAGFSSHSAFPLTYRGATKANFSPLPSCLSRRPHIDCTFDKR